MTGCPAAGESADIVNLFPEDIAMEARHQLQRLPSRAFLIGMAVFVLALLSAVGGYSLRLLTASTDTTVVRVYQPAAPSVGALQPRPNPDTLDHVQQPASAAQGHANPDTLDHAQAPAVGSRP